MKKKFFCLVCKTENGAIYVNSCLHEGFELQDCFEHCSKNSIKVIDVLTVDIDFSEYGK